MYNNGIYISVKYKKEDYQNISLEVDSPKEDWKKAVHILDDRINGRYLTPLKKMIKGFTDPTTSVTGSVKGEENFINYGFIAMTTNCLLIETLLQFKEGKDKIDNNAKQYKEFLLNNIPFSSKFDEITAKRFYKDIRCGLLHSAQTKNKSELTFYSSSLIEKINGDKSIRVDIGKMTEIIEEYYKNYRSQLLDSNQETLRENFINKMNFIVDN